MIAALKSLTGWNKRDKSTQIFISYRRSDTGGYARGLWEKLQQHTRRGALFYDKGKIDSGADFPQVISRAVLEARVVLVLIGPDWASQANLDRLHEKNGKVDYVRREVALALTRHSAGGSVAAEVIPVLLGDGTAMPDAADLPADLADLPPLNAHLFNGTHDNWQDQFARLLERLKKVSGVEIVEPRRWTYRALVLFALIAALGFAAWYAVYPALTQAHDYLRMGRYDLAVQETQQTPAILAWWPDLRLTGEKAQLGQDFAAEQPDGEKLGKRLAALLAAHPDDPDLMVLQAAQSYRARALEEVLVYTEAAFKSDPDYAEAWYLRGLAFDERGDHARAEGDYKKAATLASESPQYRGNYAAKLLERGAYAEAIANYGIRGGIRRYPLARLEEAKAQWALGAFTDAAARQQDAQAWLKDAAMQNEPYNRRAWVFYLVTQGVLLPTVEEKRCYTDLALAASRALESGQPFPAGHCATQENRKHLRDLLADDLCRYVVVPQPGKAGAALALRRVLGESAACPAVPPSGGVAKTPT